MAVKIETLAGLALNAGRVGVAPFRVHKPRVSAKTYLAGKGVQTGNKWPIALARNAGIQGGYSALAESLCHQERYVGVFAIPKVL